MSEEIKLPGEFFGYHTIVKDGEQIVTLKGTLVTELDVDMEVTLLGDSRGYIPGGFTPGETARILAFTMPFENYHSDDIIEVSNGMKTGWVKPSNIQTTTYKSEVRSRAEAQHRRIKAKTGKAFSVFMDAVYRRMPDSEKADLPRETMDYVNAMVAYALSRLPELGNDLAVAVAGVYAAHPLVRLIHDPVRSDGETQACLYLDKEGYLISVINPQVVANSAQERYIKDYDYYIVLNGPQAGKQIYSDGNPPGAPVYKQQSTENHMNTPATGNTEQKAVSVFISYAHKDEKMKDELVEQLSGLKRKHVISAWTDRQILGGEVWDDAIKKNLEEARIILFLVSAAFMNSNYSNDVEVKRAIEKHEKGEAVIVPIVIRFCDFNSLPLSKFQALPKNARPIEDWKPRSKGWLNVIDQLKDLIASLDK